MSDKLRFGLIGCGDFGWHFGKYILERAEITAVSDLNEEAMTHTQKQLGTSVPAYTDYREMLEKEELDAVAITAANFVHCEMALAAAEKGLHIYCEKAMATTTEECWQMVHAAKKKNLKLMVGHKRRLRVSWNRMIELTADDMLGEPLAITVAQYADMRPYDYPSKWWAKKELSGGFYAMLGVHVIDWFRSMCGNAKQVSAMYGPQQEKGLGYPDISHATFMMESNALASINSSVWFPIHKFREAQGPMCQCRHGGFKLVPHMEHLDLYWQRIDEEEMHHERFDINEDFDPAYRKELGDFVDWITEDKTPCLTWEEGLRCVEMMDGAYQSADKGGDVVKFPLHPELEI